MIIMKLLNKLNLEVKKSKFIAYYYSVNSEEEVALILNELKKEHKKANHIPYAYKINNKVKKTDDGEPKNTAGLPLFNVIERNNLNEKLIIVVRYFGGTLLGTGNLARTFSKISNQVIKLQEKN